MSAHATRLVITTIITSLLSMACFIVGYFVNIWWFINKNNIKTTVGLWKTCIDYQNGTEKCVDRTDLLSFKNEKGELKKLNCYDEVPFVNPVTPGTYIIIASLI